MSATGTDVDGRDVVAAHWDELVTAALLGTDRRPAPPAPAGPIADLVDDAVRQSPAGRMLADVAATAVALRAGRRPGPVASDLQPPAADPRPEIVPAAAASWWRVVADWPVLEDEWFLTAIDGGWRLSPDVLVPALVRHRSDAVRSARVLIAGGPVVAWIAGHVPDLGVRSTGRVDPDAVMRVPELAVPADLAELLAADGPAVADALRDGFDAGRYANAHRAVLVNLLARCRPDALDGAAQGLDAVAPGAPSSAMAHALADLARLRAHVLDVLRPAVA